jgi:hypothetical protein
MEYAILSNEREKEETGKSLTCGFPSPQRPAVASMKGLALINLMKLSSRRNSHKDIYWLSSNSQDPDNPVLLPVGRRECALPANKGFGKQFKTLEKT